ncbi:MAG: signal peptidase II [Streptomyces sp.]|nr:signal peptidase II [Streptomyces sp.]
MPRLPARARSALVRGGTHRVLFASSALGVAAADQAGKAWAVATRQGPAGQDPATLVRNTGASFGLGSRWTVVISLVTLAAVFVLVGAGWRARGRAWVVALALMAGGAAGNGTDRLLRAPGPLRGAVVDWITVPGYGPLFNLADVALRSGAVLALFLLLGHSGRHRAGPARTADALRDPASPR